MSVNASARPLLRRGLWRLIVVAVTLSFTVPVSLDMGAVLPRREPSTPPVPHSAVRIISKWADHYGVDEDLAVRIAVAESSLDCAAHSNESSAGGLFQFVDSTFLDTQREQIGRASCRE